MKENSKSNYEEELNAEIEERLSEMENPDYAFPRRFGKKDYIIAAAIVVIGILVLIVGWRV